MSSLHESPPLCQSSLPSRSPLFQKSDKYSTFDNKSRPSRPPTCASTPWRRRKPTRLEDAGVRRASFLQLSRPRTSTHSFPATWQGSDERSLRRWSRLCDLFSGGGVKHMLLQLQHGGAETQRASEMRSRFRCSGGTLPFSAFGRKTFLVSCVLQVTSWLDEAA